jgi:hypothetical protein
MKRRNFLKTIAASALCSVFLPRIFRFKNRDKPPYPGPIKNLQPDKIKQEGPWTG